MQPQLLLTFHKCYWASRSKLSAVNGSALHNSSNLPGGVKAPSSVLASEPIPQGDVAFVSVWLLLKNLMANVFESRINWNRPVLTTNSPRHSASMLQIQESAGKIKSAFGNSSGKKKVKIIRNIKKWTPELYLLTHLSTSPSWKIQVV